MDRPPPAHTSMAANHSSSPGSNNAQYHHHSASDRLAHIMGPNAMHLHCNSNSQSPLEFNTGDALFSMLPSSLAYAIQLVQPILLYPLYVICPGFIRQKQTAEESSSKQRHFAPVRALLRKAQQLWYTYGVSLQFILYMITCSQILDVFLTWASSENIFPSLRIMGQSQSAGADANLVKHPDAQHHLMPTNGGNYSRRHQPDWLEVFWILFVMSTLISAMLVFSRIFPPLLDWIAGGAVVKDVKLEGRHSHASLNPKKRGGAWRELLCLPSESGSLPWVERQRSIGPCANRLQTSIYFVMTRLLENIVLFVIAPRSHYICRFTGHCAPGPSAVELSCLLHPTGYTQPMRRDCQTSELMERHFESFCIVLVGVVVVTVFLLTAQTVLLQRSYLATLAHIMTDWKRIRPPQSIMQVCKSVLFTKHNHRHQQPHVWDPHRKYRQGDTVAYPNSHGAIYQATCHTTPEGRPPDDHLLYGYDVSSSRNNIVLSMAQQQTETIVVGHVVWTIVSILWVDGQQSSWWLLWVLAAQVLAGHCLVGASTASTSSNHKHKLQQLSAQLNHHSLNDLTTSMTVATGAHND